MAARTLREAIFTALTDKHLDLTENQIRYLEGNLRDFFAHRPMIILGPAPTGEEDVLKWKFQESTLSAYFHLIFKDVHSYQDHEDEK